MKKLLIPALAALLLSGCEAPPVLQTAQDRQALSAAVSGEAPGNYFLGRRFYKVDYKMWGWIKKPGEPWKKSQLVMLNEQKKLAPDRERNAVGSDNNYEYRIMGYFSGEKIYEPASDSFYPEFVLTSTSVISTNPVLVYPDKRWTDPVIRLITGPQY
jgi:hypothetical protein